MDRLLARAEERIDVHDDGGAEEAAMRAAAVDPSDARAHLLLGRIHAPDSGSRRARGPSSNRVLVPRGLGPAGGRGPRAALDTPVRARAMSGHNRWTKIKRQKEAMGASKGKLFTKLIKEITVAARLGGGDPGGNARLRSAMLAAREANMPGDTITRAVKKGTGELEGVHYDEVTYEGYGPGRGGGAGGVPDRQPEPHRRRRPGDLQQGRREPRRRGRGGLELPPQGAASRSSPARARTG